MAGRFTVWCAVLAFVLIAACSVDQPQSVETTLGIDTSSSAPPATAAATASTASPSTTAPAPGSAHAGLILSVYQLEMVGLRLEVPIILEFATRTHDDWDRREGELARSERRELYGLTEGKLGRLVAWTQELGARTAVLESVAGPDSGYVGLWGAAVRVEDAARAILDGLQLPSSAETEQGAARRLAMLDFQRAAADLDEAALEALGDDMTLSLYETDMIELRLEVAGLSHRAGEVNRSWDDRETGYARTEWELANLEGRVLELVDRMQAVDPPEVRRDAYRVVEQACDRLEAASEGMLGGLRLARSAEDVSGSNRIQALEEFRDAAETFDRAAAIALGMPVSQWRPLPPAPAPTIVMPDTDPPALAVSSPASGSVISESTATISGTTESGAFVAANGEAADVDETSAWSVQLALDPGSNVVTVTATDAAGNVTTITQEIRRLETADQVESWLTEVILSGSSQDDLFFSAFTIDSGGVFDPDRHRTEASCFAGTVVSEMAGSGPKDLYPALEDWAVSKPASDRQTYNELRELLGRRSHDERLLIGQAALAGVDECGHVREAIATRYTGDWPGACVVDEVDTRDLFAEYVALGLAAQVDAHNEPEVEAGLEVARAIWQLCVATP